MAERRKSDRDSVREFVEAHRKREPDNANLRLFDETEKAKRSDRSRRAYQTRRTREQIRARASTSKGREPVSARVLAPGPVSTPRMPHDVVPPKIIGPGPQRVRTPHAPGPARPPAGMVPPAGGAGAGRRRGGRNLSPQGYRAVTETGNTVASRQQTKALLGARPPVSGGAVGGAAAGAATGAALGSVVPGVGTAVGAGAGTVLGGAGGALSGSRRKRAYNRAVHPAPGARKALVAEFAVCVVIVALSPLTDKHKTDAPSALMKRFAAVMGVFLILALLSAAGRGPARAAAAFGGLVALVL